MTISYTNPDEKVIIRQPLLKRFRSFYRSPRRSSKENLYSQQMYMDIKRIYLSLELLNTQILNKVKVFLGQEQDVTHITAGDGSRYYDLTQDSLEFYDFTNDETVVKLDTMDSIGGRLSNIIYKVNKLEKTI